MMTNKGFSILVMVALLATLTSFVATATADQHSGTWKMNPAKSKFSPGPGMRSLTETIASGENGLKVDANGTDSDGRPLHIEFNAKFDGQDYPVSGVPWADTVSVVRTDARTEQATQNKGGRVTITITCSVSTDQKMRTCTLQGKDEQGRQVHNLVVFDRQ